MTLARGMCHQRTSADKIYSSQSQTIIPARSGSLPIRPPEQKNTPAAAIPSSAPICIPVCYLLSLEPHAWQGRDDFMFGQILTSEPSERKRSKTYSGTSVPSKLVDPSAYRTYEGRNAAGSYEPPKLQFDFSRPHQHVTGMPSNRPRHSHSPPSTSSSPPNIPPSPSPPRQQYTSPAFSHSHSKPIAARSPSRMDKDADSGFVMSTPKSSSFTCSVSPFRETPLSRNGSAKLINPGSAGSSTNYGRNTSTQFAFSGGRYLGDSHGLGSTYEGVFESDEDDYPTSQIAQASASRRTTGSPPFPFSPGIPKYNLSPGLRAKDAQAAASDLNQFIHMLDELVEVVGDHIKKDSVVRISALSGY